MSDGPSTRNRRITRTDFRPCSTCRSRSQAPFYSYALRTIADRAEGTFVHLRYTLGGDRPSQTTRLTRSLGRITASVSATPAQGWCSIVALRLPPTLYMRRSDTMPGCSKAPWGLSVLWWVTGIFTGITISPSLSLRQRSSRYAFRAGRNLPDKEFRYLRTVIVTAAVYRGFNSELRLAANPSF